MNAQEIEIGNRIETKHGEGVLVAYEVIPDLPIRYVVQLDDSPFEHNLVFYWPSQVTQLPNVVATAA